MVKNYPTIIVIFSLLILVAYIYHLNKEENFTATTTTNPDSIFIHGTRPISRENRDSTLDLDLCNSESRPGELNRNLSRGINTIYKNHVNRNIKKYIDNFVQMQILTDRVNSMNNRLMQSLHKNKKYSTEGDITFY